MKLPSKRNAVIAGVAIAALASGGGAYAATQSSGTNEPAFISDAAGRLHVSPSQLESALRGAAMDRLDAAVAAGKLTQAQANAIKQRLANGGGLGFAFGEHHFGHGVFRGGLTAAESYLKLSGPQIKSELQSGKTLAQIATEHGKSASGLAQAIETAVRGKLDAAVKAGDLTSAQEQRILANLSSHVDALINGHAPRFGESHHRGAF